MLSFNKKKDPVIKNKPKSGKYLLYFLEFSFGLLISKIDIIDPDKSSHNLTFKK